MERFKKIMLKLLYPHFAVSVLIVVIAAFSLISVFAYGLESRPGSYVIYVFSFYALCVVCANTVRLVKGTKKYLHQNIYTEKYLSDAELRARVSLYAGVLINIGYAIFKFAAGVLYSSVWFGAVAIYYIVLSLIRFLLIKADRVFVKSADDTYCHGWKSYRLCGILLLLLNTAMSGMAVQVIWCNEGYFYPGFVIYASAAYTFYRLTVAIIRISGRKISNPILLATKALDLSMALMAMFTLQTAMFASFGKDMTVESRRLMNILTGGAVCVAVLGIAFVMINVATKKLRMNRAENDTEVFLDGRIQ